MEIRLLGAFEVRVNGRAVPSSVWRQRRAATIVKLLALESGHRLHREQLLETLWPELDTESAANNLRGALHHARRGLEEAGASPGVFLTRDGDVVILGPLGAVQIDVEAFSEEVSRAWLSADPAIAAHAAELYAGDLLPDDLYEEWVAARRESLRASYLSLLTRWAWQYEERGAFPQAIAVCERILQVAPLDETAHAALMRLHARMGNTLMALAQYARLQSLLHRELDVSPEPATQALAAAIQAGSVGLDLSPAAMPETPQVLRVWRLLHQVRDSRARLMHYSVASEKSPCWRGCSARPA
jgi:DNA-binding SARP family transcriptional activator